MKRISLKNLAEQSSYSRSTLFRVLRNAPGVRASTREEVVRLLNLHGYVVEHHSGPEKIVIDTPVQNLYPEELAERIGERLKLEQYQVTLTRSWKQKALFLREIADADAVIFSATSPLELLRRAKDTNPGIYRISLFSRCPEESELTIGVDNFGGAILAAILLPALDSVRKKPRNGDDLSHQKLFGITGNSPAHPSRKTDFSSA